MARYCKNYTVSYYSCGFYFYLKWSKPSKSATGFDILADPKPLSSLKLFYDFHFWLSDRKFFLKVGLATKIYKFKEKTPRQKTQIFVKSCQKSLKTWFRPVFFL